MVINFILGRDINYALGYKIHFWFCFTIATKLVLESGYEQICVSESTELDEQRVLSKCSLFLYVA